MERGDDALRLRACDVLLAAGQHDPQPLRLFIEGAVPGGPPGAKPAKDNRRLLGTLIATLGTPNENGLQEQVRRESQASATVLCQPPHPLLLCTLLLCA